MGQERDRRGAAGVSDELPIVMFRDLPGRRREDLVPNEPGGNDRRGRRAEAEACAFYLEHRDGPRQRSITSDERLRMPYPGRTLPTCDVEQTTQLIDRATLVLPPPWRGPVVVALGWSLGTLALQEKHPADGGPPYLERAGYPFHLPDGLSRHALLQRGRDLREELIALGVIDRRVRRFVEAEDLAPAARSFTKEERMAVVDTFEAPLIGWQAIAEFLDVSKDTAHRWGDELGMPVSQPARRRRVRAYPSVLRAWELQHRPKG
jgi:hypothetical protein